MFLHNNQDIEKPRVLMKNYKNICFFDWLLGLKKEIVCNCNGLKKLGRSVEKILGIIFLGQKCVLCMFYVDWELGGRKKLWGMDIFE